MGSGSFGGGSGSFGGSTGGRAARSGQRRQSCGSDSAQGRMLGLSKLTARVNANPEITKLTATIYGMLQDRTRSAFLRAALSDPMVLSAYRELLSLNDALQS